jgi:hypothetical protein
VPERSLTDETGRVIRYKATRFIGEVRAREGHRVLAGQRLDHIAYLHYRDAERFWRIADANLALWPADLLEESAILGIPPSEG